MREFAEQQLVDSPDIKAAELRRRIEAEGRRVWPGTYPSSENALRRLLSELRERGIARELLQSHRWSPGGVDHESPSDTAYLRRLALISQAVTGQGMTHTEAESAIQIKIGVEGLDPVVQWVLAREYALRCINGAVHRTPVNTSDLDLLLTLQPWLRGTRTLYWQMVEIEWAPSARVSFREEWEAFGLEFPEFMEWVHGQMGLTDTTEPQALLASHQNWNSLLQNAVNRAARLNHKMETESWLEDTSKGGHQEVGR